MASIASSIIVDQWGRPYTFAHGADRNPARGPQFYDREDDIDRLIPSHDRRRLAALSNRLFTNMGVPRACVLQKADYSVGEAWLPNYVGPDKDAARSLTAFMSDVWLPQCDVRGGVWDWWKVLEVSSIAIDVAGDIFWLMVKGDDGFPRIQIIPGHRCKSDPMEKVVESGTFAGYRLCDGVIYNRSGRPAGYRFDLGKDGDELYVDVPASDIIHLYDPTHGDQGRGLPAFTHALESLKMSLFSTEDERIRQQIISRLHLTVFNDSGAPDLDDPMTTLEGSGSELAKFSSFQFPGGIQYIPAESNQRIEQIKHDNPGDVWESFQDRLVRDAVISVWSYSVWKAAGQGTAERAEVLKCRRFVTKRQGVLWHAAKRAFTWAAAVFMGQGRFPMLKRPTAWEFSYPPRLTVDDGRESKMELDELRTGSRNLDEVLAARGVTEERFLMNRAWTVATRKAIARKVSDEASKKYGMEIEIADREMFMQTPNETAAADAAEPMNEPETTSDDDDETGND